jgi:hypothetical protein
MVVVLLGGCISFAFLAGLILTDPHGHAHELQFSLGSLGDVSGNPRDYICLIGLLLTMPLTVAGAILLRDKHED